MANFLVSLWESIFTPGPTPTLLLATNATFGSLQLLLLVLLIATRSIHFIVLSILCGGLWYSINWFAREMRIAKEEDEAKRAAGASKKSDDIPGSPVAEDPSDTETEEANESNSKIPSPQPPPRGSSLRPADTDIRKRQSLGDSSGYVSTDSEWERVSDVDEKGQ